VPFCCIRRIFACIPLIDKGDLDRFAGLILHAFGHASKFQHIVRNGGTIFRGTLRSD
jgi:hypothetical protein